MIAKIFKRIPISTLVLAGSMVPFMISSSIADDNILVITGETEADGLVIRQTEHGTNSARIILDGTNVLSSEQSWLRGSVSPLQPNVLVQQGFGHELAVSVSGNSNQLSVQQIGSGSDARLLVAGQDNIAAIQQYGHGNTTSVTQMGQRNSVVISQ